jgi:hypothetical protein
MSLLLVGMYENRSLSTKADEIISTAQETVEEFVKTSLDFLEKFTETVDDLDEKNVDGRLREGKKTIDRHLNLFQEISDYRFAINDAILRIEFGIIAFICAAGTYFIVFFFESVLMKNGLSSGMVGLYPKFGISLMVVVLLLNTILLSANMIPRCAIEDFCEMLPEQTKQIDEICSGNGSFIGNWMRSTLKDANNNIDQLNRQRVLPYRIQALKGENEQDIKKLTRLYGESTFSSSSNSLPNKRLLSLVFLQQDLQSKNFERSSKIWRCWWTKEAMLNLNTKLNKHASSWIKWRT